MLTYKTRWISVVYNLGRLALVLLSVGVVGLILWAIDRGLGIFDEGYALLAARYPEALQVRSTSFHVFTSRIFQLMNYDVVLFRLSGLALLLLSWSFLGWGFTQAASRFFSREMAGMLRNKAYTWSFLLLGVLLYYQWYMPTPTYNMLTAIAVNTLGGVILLEWSYLAASARLMWPGGGCLAAAGAIIALAFFNKFPVGFALSGVALVALICGNDLSVAAKVRGLVSMMVGILVAAGLYFSFLQSPWVWWKMFHNGVKNAVQASHSPAALLKAYQADLGSACLMALGYVWPALLAAGVWLLCLAIFKHRWPVLMALSPWAVCVILIVFTLRAFGLHLQVRENLMGRNVFGFYLGWLILLAVIGGATRLTHGRLPGFSRREVVRVLILAGALGVLPFAGGIGTGTPLSFNVQFYLGAWFALMALGLAIIAVWQRGTFIYYTGLVLVGIFAAFQTAGYATTGRIYLGGHTLIEQKIPVQVGWPPSELRLDTDMAAAVQDLRSIAQAAGFQPGDDVVAFDLMPGLVFALGGRSPGIPFYRVHEMMSINQIGFRLTGADRLRRAFILTRTTALSKTAKLMHSEGIAFPESYSNVGAAQMSAGEVFSLWRPNPARNAFVWKTVYTHKEHLEIVGKEPYNEVGFVLPESLNRNGVYKLELEYQTVEAAVPYSIVIQSPYDPKNIPLHYLLELTEKTRSVEIMFVTAKEVEGPGLILRNWSSMGKFIVSKVTLFRLGAVAP